MSAASLFVNRDYTGAYADLEEGDYNITHLSARGSVGNDTVSSLRIAAGYQVTVYTDADFRGDSRTFTADTPYVGDDFNDAISSVSVSRIDTPRISSAVPDSVVFIQPPPVT